MSWYADFIVIAFATVCGGAGMMYAMRSTAAQGLSEIEALRRNQIRNKLRKFGGMIMVGVGVCLIAGYLSTRGSSPSAWSLVPWAVLLVLILALMCLALVDLRLTQMLRRDLQTRHNPRPDSERNP